MATSFLALAETARLPCGLRSGGSLRTSVAIIVRFDGHRQKGLAVSINDGDCKTSVAISILGKFDSDPCCVAGRILHPVKPTARFIPDFTFGADDVKIVVVHFAQLSRKAIPRIFFSSKAGESQQKNNKLLWH
jgi:hypothetical protein